MLKWFGLLERMERTESGNKTIYEGKVNGIQRKGKTEKQIVIGRTRWNPKRKRWKVQGTKDKLFELMNEGVEKVQKDMTGIYIH